MNIAWSVDLNRPGGRKSSGEEGWTGRRCEDVAAQLSLPKILVGYRSIFNLSILENEIGEQIGEGLVDGRTPLLMIETWILKLGEDLRLIRDIIKFSFRADLVSLRIDILHERWEMWISRVYACKFWRERVIRLEQVCVVVVGSWS